MAKKKDCTAMHIGSLRVLTGLIFLIAGLAKLFWMTDPTWIQFLTDMGWTVGTTFFAWIVIIVEIVAGILLLLGALTRYSSIALGIVMIVAVILKLIAWGGWLAAWDNIRFDLLLIAVLALFYSAGPGSCKLIDKFKN